MTTTSFTAQAAYQSYLNQQVTTPVSIADTSQNVANDLAQLQILASANLLSSVTLTDSGALTVSALTLLLDADVLTRLSGNYTLQVSDFSLAGGANAAYAGHIKSLTVLDTSANVVANLDGISAIAAAGASESVVLLDGGIPQLSLTPAQLASDAAGLNAISGYYTVLTQAGTSSADFSGPLGHGTTVVFGGTAASYSVTSNAQGILTVSGNGITDHLGNITALQFSDHTEIVAQTPSTSAVTTGNITELYSAVLAREPDVAGLAYYQAELAANPAIPITTFAQWFLASPEYVNNSAHAYAQNATGDAQFVTDTYNNLLHRAPEAGAVDWYLANVINPILGNLAPGTAAYTAAEALAHAQVLVNFSASTEFTADVQVTAQHPADATHWLVLT